MAGKSIDWRPGPTVCRCCLTEGCYKDISTEYFWMGKREVYSEMLLDSFDLSISYSQSGAPNSNSRLICEPCISRLRDAADFKRQVIECEKTFKQLLDPTSSTSHIDMTFESEKDVKLEKVKLEKNLSDDEDFLDDAPGFGDDDDDDLDDQPLTKLATKIPKKEAADLLDLLDSKGITVKRKATAKAKVPAKKSKTVAKPSASKIKLQTEPKKKKESDPALPAFKMAKQNAEALLRLTTLYPFRLQSNMLICVYCCESYDSPEVYRVHVDTDHKKFSTHTAFSHLRSKIDTLKVDCTNLKCKLCYEEFDKVEEVAQHIHEHHDPKSINLKYDLGVQPYKLTTGKWACCICNMKLPSLVKLGKHTISHYRKYTCDVCGRNYLTTESLKLHVKFKHNGTREVCRKCHKEFPTVEEKRKHVKETKSCWQFVCIQCGERFLSWESKSRHLIEHHGIAKKKYDCPECNMKFDGRKHFYTHYKLEHTDDGYVCTCCGLKFTTKDKLDDHRIVHTGEKRHTCTVCFKNFSRNKSLIQHMWIHSEYKRFSCKKCMKQFSQKISLQGHMKSHHPNVKLV